MRGYAPLVLSIIAQFVVNNSGVTASDADKQCEFYGQHLPHPGSKCQYMLCTYDQFSLKAETMRCPPGTSIDVDKIKRSGGTGEYPCTVASSRCGLAPSKPKSSRYNVRLPTYDPKDDTKHEPVRKKEPRPTPRPYRYASPKPRYGDYDNVKRRVNNPGLFKTQDVPKLPDPQDYVHDEYPVVDVKKPAVRENEAPGAYTRQVASPKRKVMHEVHGYIPPSQGKVVHGIRYPKAMAGGKAQVVVTRDRNNPNKLRRVTTLKKPGVKMIVEETAVKDNKKSPGYKVMGKKMQLVNTTKEKDKDGVTRTRKSFQYSSVQTSSSQKKDKYTKIPVPAKGKDPIVQKHIIHAPPKDVSSLYPQVPKYNAPRAYNIPAYRNPYAREQKPKGKEKPAFKVEENGFSFQKKDSFPFQHKPNTNRGLFDLI